MLCDKTVAVVVPAYNEERQILTVLRTMIAALSQAVPVTTIGWSHKYAEAADPFGMSAFTMDYTIFNAEHLVAMVQQLLDRRKELHDGGGSFG